MSEETIFSQAIAIDSDEQRAEFLEKACGDNVALRAEIEKLLGHHGNAGSFLQRPPLQATVDIQPDALEAGLAATFDSRAAVVLGSAGHSVLKSLGKQLKQDPNVTLREVPDEVDRAVKPGSAEVPDSDNDSRYQLHGEIARGGMGAVIKGRDTDLGRDLAIKVLLDTHKDKPEILQRFVEEAQIGGQLQHPGIAPVYELGQFGDQRPFFTMKLVKGETLAAILAKRESPSEEIPKLLGIFEQMCQTMAYAHTKGVIHRDLKPANIMVGAFGEVQVVDWGLSKVMTSGGVSDERKSLDQHRNVSVIETRRSVGSASPGSVGSDTQMGSVMGTPAYMPPEQALGEVDRLDERADVFGLGAILAEVLTGKPAYVADTASEVFRMANRGKLDDCLSRLDACGAETELIDLCKKSLSPEPVDRFRNASVLSDAITKHLEGVQERLKESELGEARAQTRRKLSVAIAGLMLLLAIGTGLAAYSFRESAERERKQNEVSRALATDKTLLAEENAVLAAENRARWQETESARQLAVQNQRKASTSLLAATSRVVDNRSQRLLLSIEAAERSRNMDVSIRIFTHAAVLEALHNVHGRLLSDGEDALYKSWPIAFSPDSRWLVVCNRLRDVQSGFSAESARTLTANRVWHLALSNKWLAYADEVPGNSHVRLMSLGAKDQIIDLPWEAGRPTSAMQISHDERWLAVAGNSQQLSGKGKTLENESAIVRLWDLDALDVPPRDFETSKTTKAITFDARSRKIAMGMLQGRIRILDLDDPNAPLDFPSFSELRPGNALGVYMKITDDFSHLVSGGQQGAPIRYWDLSAKQSTDSPTLLDAHHSTSRGVVFSGDGTRMFSIGHDATAREWDLTQGGAPNAKRLFHGHTGSLMSISLTPDERWLITGGGDDTIRLWDLESESPSLSPIVLRGLGDEVLYTEVSPNGRWLVAGGHQKFPRIWDLAQIETVRSPILFFGQDARFIANGNALLARNADTIRTFSKANRDTGMVARDMAIPEDRTCLGYSQNSEWLVVGRADGSLELYDTLRQELSSRMQLLDSSESTILQVAVSDDGQLVIAADESGVLYRWQVTGAEDQGGEKLIDMRVVDSAQPLNGNIGIDQLLLTADKSRLIIDHAYGVDVCQLSHTLTVSSSFRTPPGKWGQAVQISPDGQRLIVAMVDGPIRYWNFSDMNAAREPALLPKGHATCLSNSKLITVQPNYLVAKVRQLDNPANEPVELIGHNSWIRCLAISDDERRVATGSRDGTIYIWNLGSPDPSAVPLVLRGHDTAISRVDFHPSGKQLVSSSGGEIRIWDLEFDAAIARARSQAGRELTEDERVRYGLDDSVQLVARSPFENEKTEVPSPIGLITPIFDGSTLNGWQREGNGSWQVQNGEIIGRGGRLVYMEETYEDVEVSLECRLARGGNSGLHLRTKLSETKDSWKIGYEAQIANRGAGGGGTLTGGVYNYSVVEELLTKYDEWFKLTFRVVDNELTVFVNDVQTTQVLDPSRKFKSGRISLQGSAGSVRFRNIKARRL